MSSKFDPCKYYHPTKTIRFFFSKCCPADQILARSQPVQQDDIQVGEDWGVEEGGEGGGRLECIENTSTTPKLPVKFKGKNAKKLLGKLWFSQRLRALLFPRAKYFFLATPKYLSATLFGVTLRK